MVLLFLQRLAAVHQAFVLATRRGIRQESINALADTVAVDLLQDGFAKLVCFGLNFCWHILARIKHILQASATPERSNYDCHSLCIKYRPDMTCAFRQPVARKSYIETSAKAVFL